MLMKQANSKKAIHQLTGLIDKRSLIDIGFIYSKTM
jgi:hypothetical protein